MPNITATLAPSAVNTINSGWCVKNYSDWLASAEPFAVVAGTYTVQFRYVEGYSTPADQTVTVAASNVAITRTYGAISWKADWQPPVSICLFRGQVFTCGSKSATAGTARRLVRWSEIGAFRFLDCTANPFRNEAGVYYVGDNDEDVALRVLPLKSAVICYGAYSITAFTPVKDPVPGFKIDRIADIGIKNPLAVNGSENQHVFVDRHGYLRTLTITTDGLRISNLGYQHIFAGMQDDYNMVTGLGIINVVYNKVDEEFYISDGLESYRFARKELADSGRRSMLDNSNDLSELSKAYTSVIGTRPIIGAVFDLLAGGATRYLQFETETIDLGMSAIKTISTVEVLGNWAASATVEVMVKWRNDRSTTFTSTSWVRCSPDGFASPMVSGRDLRICVRIDNHTGAIIEAVILEWQLSDKHSVRGNYTSVNSASTNTGRG